MEIWVDTGYKVDSFSFEHSTFAMNQLLGNLSITDCCLPYKKFIKEPKVRWLVSRNTIYHNSLMEFVIVLKSFLSLSLYVRSTLNDLSKEVGKMLDSLSGESKYMRCLQSDLRDKGTFHFVS